jgi:hypothetical protein
MSVKSSNGKTNADLSGTYVLHQFMDDATGTYTETAKSNSGSGTNPLDPTQSFDYIFDTTDPINPDTFLIVDPSGIDHLYGVMSPDTNVLWTCKCQ